MVSEQVAPRQDEDGVAGLQLRLVLWDDEKTIGAAERGDVARALPGKLAHGGFVRRPLEESGKEMREAAFLAHRSGKAREQQRQGSRLGAAQQIEGGDDKKLERDHRRNGIAGQAENRDAAANAENGRAAGANGDRVEEKLRAEIAQDRFNEVVFTHRDAAGKNQRVGDEALLDGGANRVRDRKSDV